MSADWKIGDIALCIGGSAGQYNADSEFFDYPYPKPLPGRIYGVEGIEVCDNGGLALSVTGSPGAMHIEIDRIVGWDSACFRKIILGHDSICITTKEPIDETKLASGSSKVGG